MAFAPVASLFPIRAASACFTALLLVASAFAASTATTQIERIAYHGWSHALRLRNAHLEAIVVPEVGRVMSFRFRDGENIFWEDRSLDGQRGDPTGKTWVNFGGDKSWPSPEAEWKNYTGHPKWMPPAGFDGLPATARVEGEVVLLTSPVDAAYGVRTHRRIAFRRDEPVMTIETTYERVSGQPSKIGIWVITQFIDPVAVYLPVPARSKFPDGHFLFRDTPWPQLTVRDGLLTVSRNPRASQKLGSDAAQMLWVGEKVMCLVSTPRDASPDAEYPDRGASAEVYGSPDPKRYVELETLGPLALLKPGDRIQQTNTYTLFRRPPGTSPEAEARRILAVLP